MAFSPYQVPHDPGVGPTDRPMSPVHRSMGKMAVLCASVWTPTVTLRAQNFSPTSPSNGCFLLTPVGQTRNSGFGVRESIRSGIAARRFAHTSTEGRSMDRSPVQAKLHRPLMHTKRMARRITKATVRSACVDRKAAWDCPDLSPGRQRRGGRSAEAGMDMILRAATTNTNTTRRSFHW